MGEWAAQQPPAEEPPAPEPPKAASMRYDKDADRYELGMEVEGAWVVFAAVDGAGVRSAIENVKANEQNAPAGTAAAGVTS